MPFLKRYTARTRLVLLVMTAVVALAAASPSALAQAPRGPSDPTPPTGAESGTDQPFPGASADGGSVNEQEVEVFMDGFLGRQLEETKIPGATVSVVKDGEVLFAGGYGRADVGRGSPSPPTRRSSG